MDATKTCFRVLMFPWLAHGHIYPFLELAKRLAKRNFKIYICSTSINLDSIRSHLDKSPSSSTSISLDSIKSDFDKFSSASVNFNSIRSDLDRSSSSSTSIDLDSIRSGLDKSSLDDLSIELVELQLPSLPNLPPHYHTTKNIPPHLMQTLMQAFQMSSSNFTNIITTLSPDLLIYDGFQPWAAKIASSQNIPAVLFATSGSTALSFYHHLYTHKSYDDFPYPSIYLSEHEKRDIRAQGESIKLEDTDEGFAFGIFKLSHEVILIKSCRGIEGKYMDYLSTLCMKKIVPVGPLVTNNDQIQEKNPNSSEIINWLSQKPKHSTIYISFGSETYLSKDQIHEIAKGLELTNVNFIWVLRFPTENDQINNLEESMHLGFLDRVKDRGMVVQKWVPQAVILSHPSVGGFMSHCGWSSITESIYFGVPIVALPLKHDQPVNCKMVVEVGVGFEVKRDENGGFNGEKVAQAINKVILGENGEGFRVKVGELSEKMKMEDEEAIVEVVEELLSICMKRNVGL